MSAENAIKHKVTKKCVVYCLRRGRRIFLYPGDECWLEPRPEGAPGGRHLRPDPDELKAYRAKGKKGTKGEAESPKAPEPVQAPAAGGSAVVLHRGWKRANAPELQAWAEAAGFDPNQNKPELIDLLEQALHNGTVEYFDGTAEELAAQVAE